MCDSGQWTNLSQIVDVFKARCALSPALAKQSMVCNMLLEACDGSHTLTCIQRRVQTIIKRSFHLHESFSLADYMGFVRGLPRTWSLCIFRTLFNGWPTSTRYLHTKYCRNLIGNEHRVCNRIFTCEIPHKSHREQT